MSPRAAVAQHQAFIRTVYRAPIDVVTELDPPDQPKAAPFTPRTLEAVFAEMALLFATAAAMADGGDQPERGPGGARRPMYLPIIRLGRRGEERRIATRAELWPIEVTRVSLASPLDVVAAVKGAYATPRFFRAVLDLLLDIYNVRGHIRARRAELEARELAATVESVKYQRELVALGAQAVRNGRRTEWMYMPAYPDSVEIWTDDEPPELASG